MKKFIAWKLTAATDSRLTRGKNMSQSHKVLLGILSILFIILFNIIAYRIIFIQANSEIGHLKRANFELQAMLEEEQAKVAELEAQSESPVKVPANAENNDIFEMNGLVEVRSIDPAILVDLIYATDKNFTGQVLYKVEVCLLRRGTAEKLAAANAEFGQDGYRLKVWDAYRPRSVQRIMWQYKPDGVYVADPDVGSNHNKGAAIDVTLVDKNGYELEMPTDFDDFSEQASRNYAGMSETARNNMDYLTAVMVKHGFKPIQSEWWHFNDEDLAQYDFLTLTLEEWVNSYFAHYASEKK